MNDDFLHRLHKPPPPEFLDGLKARLDRQSPLARARPRRFPFSRGLIVGLLLGSAAFAITSLSVNSTPASFGDFLKAPAQLLARMGGSSQSADSQQHRGAPLAPAWLPTHVAPAAQGEMTSKPATSGATVATRPAAAVPKARSLPAQPISPSTGYGRIVAAAGAYPHALNVVERFAAGQAKVSLAKSGAGLSSLCEGDSKTGAEFAELLHRVTPAELRNCLPVNITELKIGHQAIVLARSRLYGSLQVSARDLFLALARQVPVPTDPVLFVDNPNTTWNQVDGTLPYDRIHVLGPPLGGVQGKLAAALLLEAGCNTYPAIAELRSTDPARYEEICTTLRSDEVYEVRAEGLAAYVESLEVNPTVLGVFTLTEFAWSKERLTVTPIDGIEASSETITADNYPASRTLYLYTNQRYLTTSRLVSAFLTAHDIYGNDPSEWGFVPLTLAEHAEVDETLKRHKF
jgi:phosphate transport system substrate-binding protein